MNSLRFLAIFLLLPICSLAQSELADRVEWLDAQFHARKRQNSDDALNSLRHALRVSIDAVDPEAEARVRKELGVLQLTQIPLYDSAFFNLLRAYELEDSLRLTQEQVITSLAMARVFEELDDYHKAMELLNSATELSRPVNDADVLAYILNTQGRIHTLMGAAAAALENYEVVLKTKDDLRSRRYEGDAYYNIGTVYGDDRNFDQALQAHIKGLRIRREMKDARNEARSLNEIGKLYHAKNNFAKALANHVAALNIHTRLNDEAGLAETYNSIGALYLAQGNLQRAVSNLSLALDAGNAIQSAEQKARSFENLSICYKNAGDYRKALEYQENYSRMIEMMRSEKLATEVIESQNRQVIEKKEQKIRDLQLAQMERELTIREQRRTQNFLTALIGFGIVILLLGLYLYLVKRRANIALESAHAKVNRQNAELQNLNATKDKFFSIISHDLKGPLNSFTSFSRMLINHTESLSKEEIQMLAREIDKNLKNLFSLLENLLEWSRSQTGSIEFKPEAVDLSTLVDENVELLSTQARNKGIALRAVYQAREIANIHRHSINTVIRNLMSNAIKFTPEGGSVTVEVVRDESFVKVSITDTGVGMAPEAMAKLFRIETKYSTQGTANEKGTGLGLILCKEFVEKNGGKISVASQPGKGSTFFFTVPAAITEAAPASALAVHVKS